MVVCKFFQQGSCRFGQSCRFEHVYSSKYSYYAPQAQAPQTQAPQTGVTDEQLVNQVQSDVQSVLRGGQWILSSYAPFREKPCLPGISDLSPEEARLFIYEAKAKNCVEMAVNYLNTVTQEARSKYEQLLQPSQQIIKVLRSLYKGEAVQSPFNTNQNAFGSSNNAATSVFRSAVQNTSVFNQNANQSSVFGQNTNAFGQSPDAAKSIFAQATSAFSPPSNMSSNIFGPSQDTAKSLFGQANQAAQPTQNVFNLQMHPSVFSSPPQTNPASIFASASQQVPAGHPDPFNQKPPDPFNQKQSSPFQNAPPSNVFQQAHVASNVFGNANVFAQQVDDSEMYSTESDLTPEELEAFKSNQFKLGFVPDVPPPKSLCSM